MTTINIPLGTNQWAEAQENIKYGCSIFADVSNIGAVLQAVCMGAKAGAAGVATVTVDITMAEAGAVIEGLTARPPVNPSYVLEHIELFNTSAAELTTRQSAVRAKLRADYEMADEVYKRRHELATCLLSLSVTHINGAPFATDAAERATFADGFADRIRNMEEIVAQEHRDAETREAVKHKLHAQKITDAAKQEAEAAEAEAAKAQLADALLDTVLDIGDLGKMPAQKWLVPGFFPEHGLSFLAGAPKTGKSFAAIDLGLHVAVGKPWHGLSVPQGVVVYVCAEGSAGIGKRVTAALREHNIPADVPFYVFRPVRLADAHDVAVLIEMIRRKANGRKVALVIFDTLSRMIPAIEENSAGAMTPVVDNLTKVADTFLCNSFTVHHTGRDASKGMRGSTVLTGAADSVVLLHGRENGVGPASLVCSHRKDGGVGAEVLVTFAIVNKGAENETLVMRHREVAPDRAEPAPAEAQDGAANWEGPTDADGWLGGLETLLQETGQHGATGAEWFGNMYQGGADDRRVWGARWRTAADRLVKAGKLARDGDLFTLAA
jgi:AAA domain